HHNTPSRMEEGTTGGSRRLHAQGGASSPKSCGSAPPKPSSTAWSDRSSACPCGVRAGGGLAQPGTSAAAARVRVQMARFMICVTLDHAFHEPGPHLFDRMVGMRRRRRAYPCTAFLMEKEP